MDRPWHSFWQGAWPLLPPLLLILSGWLEPAAPVLGGFARCCTMTKAVKKIQWPSWQAVFCSMSCASAFPATLSEQGLRAHGRHESLVQCRAGTCCEMHWRGCSKESPSAGSWSIRCACLLLAPVTSGLHSVRGPGHRRLSCLLAPRQSACVVAHCWLGTARDTRELNILKHQ